MGRAPVTAAAARPAAQKKLVVRATPTRRTNQMARTRMKSQGHVRRAGGRSESDQRAQLLQLGRTDTRHVRQLIDAGERTVRLTIGDDVLGDSGTDTRQGVQFLEPAELIDSGLPAAELAARSRASRR